MLAGKLPFAAVAAFCMVISGCGGDSVVTPSPNESTEKPTELPPFSTLSLYSSDSPLNAKIGPNPEVDPNSAQMISTFSQDPTGLVIMLKQFSAPVYFADANTPRHDVELPCGPFWGLGVSRMKSVPIPNWAEPASDTDGADNPAVPGECGENADQDNHMIILDLTTRCEYDFWQARKKADGTWEASWGNRIEMDGSGVYANGLSTRGSGFAFLGGLIWPDELKAGQINHALVFNYPKTKSGGPVSPATASDGVSESQDAIPEGARLQLNPDLNLDSLPLEPYEKTVAKALQEYGMWLVDTGGSSGIGLYAVDPRSVQGNPYEGVLPDEDFPALSNIPLDQFRVLKLGPQDPNFQNNLEIAESTCAAFE